MRQIHTLMNLPNRDADGNLCSSIKADVRGTGEDRCIQLYCNEWKITYGDIDVSNIKNLGNTIAHLIELAMDAGFEQGQKHIRRALGIK